MRTPIRLQDADLVVSAFIQLAYCLRTSTNIDRAPLAYGTASQWRSRLVISSACSAADSAMRRSPSRAATCRRPISILEEIVSEPRSSALDDIRSRALHDRAYVAGPPGSHERSVQLAYDACSRHRLDERDRILSDYRRRAFAFPRPPRRGARRLPRSRDDCARAIHSVAGGIEPNGAGRDERHRTPVRQVPPRPRRPPTSRRSFA